MPAMQTIENGYWMRIRITTIKFYILLRRST